MVIFFILFSFMTCIASAASAGYASQTATLTKHLEYYGKQISNPELKRLSPLLKDEKFQKAVKTAYHCIMGFAAHQETAFSWTSINKTYYTVYFSPETNNETQKNLDAAYTLLEGLSVRVHPDIIAHFLGTGKPTFDDRFIFERRVAGAKIAHKTRTRSREVAADESAKDQALDEKIKAQQDADKATIQRPVARRAYHRLHPR